VKFSAGSVQIEPLSDRHDRSAFSCGMEALDRYLKQQAGQDSRRGLASVFVAADIELPQRILGYFTLSATVIAPIDLPPELARRLPRQPVPAALIGRLAVDRSVARRGLGSILLAYAIERATMAAETVAMWAVAVDPIDEVARQFYSTFGFRTLEGSTRMFMTVSRQSPASKAPS
jgi:GNAT superfamily N-acetyltransferase